MKQTLIGVVLLLCTISSNLFAQKAGEKAMKIKMLETPLQILSGHAVPYDLVYGRKNHKELMPPQYIVKDVSAKPNAAIKMMFEQIDIVDLKNYSGFSSNNQVLNLLSGSIPKNSFHGYDYILEISGAKYIKEADVRRNEYKQGDSVVIDYTPYAKAVIEVKYTFKHVDGTVLFERDYTGKKQLIQSANLSGISYKRKESAEKIRKEKGASKLKSLNDKLKWDFEKKLEADLNSQFGYACKDYEFEIAAGKGKKFDYSASEKIQEELSEIFKENKKKCYLTNKDEFYEALKPIQEKFKEGISIWEGLIAEHKAGSKKDKVSDKNVAYFHTNIAVAYLFLEEFDKASEHVELAAKFKSHNKKFIPSLRWAIKNFKARKNPTLINNTFPEKSIEQFYAVDISELKRPEGAESATASLSTNMIFDYTNFNANQDLAVRYEKVTNESDITQYHIMIKNNANIPVLVPNGFKTNKAGVLTQSLISKKGENSTEKVKEFSCGVGSAVRIVEKNYFILLPNEEVKLTQVNQPKVKETGDYVINIYLRVDPSLTKQDWFGNDNTRKVSLQSIYLNKAIEIEDHLEAQAQ